MTGRDIFMIWAPENKWSRWARPVPFVAIGGRLPNPAADFAVPRINYVSEASCDTAIILDLPGCDGIKEAVALAALGFLPVPLYNGTDGQRGAMALLDNQTIKSALIWGAKKLEELKMPEGAPPAFLLDSDRAHRFRMDAGIFDNSWDIYEQDMPTAEYFLANGIKKLIVKSQALQKDLAKILYKFQKKGIAVFFTNGYETPKAAAVKNPRGEA